MRIFFCILLCIVVFSLVYGGELPGDGNKVCSLPGNHTSYRKRSILDDCCSYCDYNCYGGTDSKKQCCGYDPQEQTCYYCTSSTQYCCAIEGEFSQGVCCEQPCGCMDCSNNGLAICEESTGGNTGKKCCRTSCCNGKCCPDGQKCANGKCCLEAKACGDKCCGALHVCHNGQCRFMYNTLELAIYLPSFGAIALMVTVYILLGCRKAARDNDVAHASNGDYTLMQDSAPTFGQIMKRYAFHILSYPYNGWGVQLLFRMLLMLPLGVFNIVEYLASNVCCRLSNDWFDTSDDGLGDCNSISSLQVLYMVVATLMWVWYLVGGILCALSGSTMTFVSTSSTQVGNTVYTTTSALTSNSVLWNTFMSSIYSILFIFGSSLVVFPQVYFGSGDTTYC